MTTTKWERLKDALQRLEDGTPPPPWAGLFGASIKPEDCKLVLVPVPWDATVSYGVGTAKGPEAVLGASHQLDLEDARFDKPYRAGITMLPEDREIASLNKSAREHAARVIETSAPHDTHDQDLRYVNEASRRVNDRVETLAREQLAAGRLVGVLGGDHSSPFGLIKALGDKYPDGFGVLHVDAHMDLRKAYEGFTDSHASIMRNVMDRVPAAKKLVQVAVRDFSAEERGFALRLGSRAAVYTGADIFRRQAQGDSWGKLAAEMIGQLPERVYISFDIDGLDPSFCPHTGTPVPGGISYDAAVYLIDELAASGRKIVGFDLCEVAPSEDGDEWDANVGSRLLYKLCGATLYSQGHCKGLW